MKNSIEEIIKQLKLMLKVRKQQKEIIECAGGSCINCDPDIRALTESIDILSDYKRILKENEELKQERELVGVPVRNKRDGKIGIILHQWKSGSIAVLENIKPRVINTHDDWNTLEIINDNVEQKRTKNDCIPIQKVKDKIKEEKMPLTIVGGIRNKKILGYGISLGRMQVLQELIEEREEK